MFDHAYDSYITYEDPSDEVGLITCTPKMRKRDEKGTDELPANGYSSYKFN